MHSLEFMCSECHLLYCCPITLVSWNFSQLKLSLYVTHSNLIELWILIILNGVYFLMDSAKKDFAILKELKN